HRSRVSGPRPRAAHNRPHEPTVHRGSGADAKVTPRLCSGAGVRLAVVRFKVVRPAGAVACWRRCSSKEVPRAPPIAPSRRKNMRSRGRFPHISRQSMIGVGQTWHLLAMTSRARFSSFLALGSVVLVGCGAEDPPYSGLETNTA